MAIVPPPSVERTHQELLRLLVSVQHLSGRTGVLAEELAKTLQPHLEREDEYALPLLGLLQSLAVGNVTRSDARVAAKLYKRMKRNYNSLGREHKELAKLIEQFKRVASEEGHLTAVRFAESLERHSEDEEELLFPAALLAGRIAAQGGGRDSITRAYESRTLRHPVTSGPMNT